MDEGRAQQMAAFVAYAKTLDGDEKGEAQVFLDRLFQAFGHGGYKEAGATLEKRVRTERGGTSFADLMWKPVVLIEMKKRGEDLTKHLRQAFDYWVRSVPGRPRYVILCNFDEFRIYDFDQSIEDPQDTLTLDELIERYEPLAFLFPTRERPRFRVDRERVTREAADLLAAVYKHVKSRREVSPPTAQRFILQVLIALFSEDIGLLPKQFFTELLDECTDPPKAFDLFDGLFRAMNTREGARGGRFKDVPYFNGGIFSESAAVELDPLHEIAILKQAASYNWSHISPDIFGTVFQHSMEAPERHAFGAHYTHQTDIMRIVGPTILQPWREAIATADSAEELRALQQRLARFRVLDPACGSGNFLYLAYRELKRIEKELIDRVREVGRERGQREFGVLTSKQFFGMDILPFAVELAKVTMTLAHKLAIDELHVEEKALPLDNLDSNIVCRDALMTGFGESKEPARTPWPEVDVIIGNPPFLSAKKVKPERGAAYVNALRALYPDVPGMADYCVYWFRRAHDHVKPATEADPFRGRVGLVGTQNVRNNQSRVGGLDHVVQSGTIVEAVDNQPWSGEASVHISIVNWVKHEPPKKPGGSLPIALEHALLLPAKRRLWRKAAIPSPLFEERTNGREMTRVARGRRGLPRKDKSFELVPSDCARINSALSNETDVSSALVLRCNVEPQRVFQGVTPGHDGFVLTPSEAKNLHARGHARRVIYPYLIGREILSGDARPERFLIDFQPLDQVAASAYEDVFERVKRRVLPARLANAPPDRGTKDKTRSHHRQFLGQWWRLSWERADMLTALARLSRYVACSRVTKRPVFVFVDVEIRPGDALQVFAFDDDYSFGILQSDAHWRWFVAKCSKLTERFRYTPESVFDTFPWPQLPSRTQIQRVAKAGHLLRRLRDDHLPRTKGGLRAMYRTLELPGKNPLKDAHAALNEAALDAYGFSAKKDILAQLLELNLVVAGRIAKGDAVTPPGIPPSFRDRSRLVTSDCIRSDTGVRAGTMPPSRRVRR